MAKWKFEQHTVCYYLDRCEARGLPFSEREIVQRLGLVSTETLNMRVRNYRWIRTGGQAGLQGSGNRGKQRVVNEYFALWTDTDLEQVVLRILEGKTLYEQGISLGQGDPTELLRWSLTLDGVRSILSELGDLVPTKADGRYRFEFEGKRVHLQLLNGSFESSKVQYVWNLPVDEEALEDLCFICHETTLNGVFVFRWNDVQDHVGEAIGDTYRLSIGLTASGYFFVENEAVSVDERFFVSWENLSPDLPVQLFPPTLRPKARLMSILGQQLIKDNTVGLIELAKNSYDADATKVTITLEHLGDPAKTRVIVEDDGFGMSREVVLGPFLEPASGHKEQQKKKRIRTPKGRLPLGEKGVGRFAAHRLGRSFLMITRAEGASREVVLSINWDSFEDGNAYLSDVPVSIYERVPTQFPDDQHGTRLEMIGAREQWTEEHVKKLSNQLQRLMSPFEVVADFRVELLCPEYAKYQQMSASDVLDRAHYVFKGTVSESGEMAYTYQFRVPGLPERTLSGSTDLRAPNKEWQPRDRQSTCGPFGFYFYAWDRTLDMLKRSNTTRAELDDRCGISLFRDGVRILPYGEPGDDWLGLDRKRIDLPVERIGNKNIIGYVEVDQVANPDLIDKTNREGLIENQALWDLKTLIGQSVTVLESLRKDDRGSEDKAGNKAPQQLTTVVNEFKEAVTEVATLHKDLSSAVEAKRTDLESSADGRRILELVKQTPRQLSAVAARTTQVTQAATDLQKNFDSQRDLLVSLAGFGLAAERFTHEFARLTKEADDALRSLLEVHYELAGSTYLGALRGALNALKNDIRNMGPLFYVRKGSAVVEVDVKDAVETAFRLHRGDIRKYRISQDISGVSFLVKMREGPCIQIFNNLIDNAVYWILRGTKEDVRRIVIAIDPDRRRVTFADSGDGIDPVIASQLFKPFTTTKQEGRGLGLYITREILEEARGTIRLANDHERIPNVPGATFVIDFPQ